MRWRWLESIDDLAMGSHARGRMVWPGSSPFFEDHFPAERHHLLCYLGGPSFAKEVAQGMPTAVVVAAKDARSAARVQQVLGTDRLRVYTTDDVVGIELGGAGGRGAVAPLSGRPPS